MCCTLQMISSFAVSNLAPYDPSEVLHPERSSSARRDDAAIIVIRAIPGGGSIRSTVDIHCSWGLPFVTLNVLWDLPYVRSPRPASPIPIVEPISFGGVFGYQGRTGRSQIQKCCTLQVV
jgi:hypothetical protein